MIAGRDNALNRALVVLLIILVSTVLCIGIVHFLSLIPSTTIIVVAATFALYIMLPLVRRLERRMPPPLAFGVAFVVFLVGAGLICWALLPPVISQAQQFVATFPQLIQDVQKDLADPNGFLSRVPPDLRTYIEALPAQLGQLASKYGFSIAQQTFSILTSAISVFLSLVIVPILTAYLYFDHRDLKQATLGFIPASWRPKAVAILSDLNDVLGGFVRGQLLDGAILGTMIFILLFLTHVPYALLIAVLAGILNFIPYVGAFIGFVPSVLLAFAYQSWQTAVVVGVGFAVIQQIDGNVIVPRIMKSQVQLSPVIIIIAILAFTGLFGVAGTFVAVPVAAMLRVLKLHFAPAPSDAELHREETTAVKLTKF